MITIRICEYERQFNRAKDIDEQWINQQINGRKECGEVVFVRVLIQLGSINLGLATPNCPSGSGGIPRILNREENAVVDLWKKRGLEDPNFASGNLIAFFKQLDHLI